MLLGFKLLRAVPVAAKGLYTGVLDEVYRIQIVCKMSLDFGLLKTCALV
jgi:hypothetical protein